MRDELGREVSSAWEDGFLRNGSRRTRRERWAILWREILLKPWLLPLEFVMLLWNLGNMVWRRTPQFGQDLAQAVFLFWVIGSIGFALWLLIG